MHKTNGLVVKKNKWENILESKGDYRYDSFVAVRVEVYNVLGEFAAY